MSSAAKLVTLTLGSETPGLHQTPVSVGPYKSLLYVPEAGYAVSKVVDATATVFSPASDEVVTAVFVDQDPSGVRVYTSSNNTEKVHAFTKSSSSATWSSSSLDDYFTRATSSSLAATASAFFKSLDLSKATRITVDLADLSSLGADVSKVSDFKHGNYSLSFLKLSSDKVVDRVVSGSTELWKSSSSSQFAVLLRSARKDNTLVVGLYCADTSGSESFKHFRVDSGVAKSITSQEYNRLFSSTSAERTSSHHSTFLLSVT